MESKRKEKFKVGGVDDILKQAPSPRRGRHLQSSPLLQRCRDSDHARASKDITGGVQSGSGRRERKERKDRNKPRRLLLEPMRTHQWSHAYASHTWEARPKGCFGTDAYTFRASMRTHQWFSASINRGALHHLKGAHFHI
ncbi:hypothetical protein PIB30_004531 [Stylosanthes scabra]|uniref:Uncharacterized protein n=1 Tax=Stylosanthes scabra TaxID=79078 RepID=A0ABU6Y1R9_9FABA|nr:hypothetical protein [Stylosanthes scabra]